jgi:hypothetical protein
MDRRYNRGAGGEGGLNRRQLDCGFGLIGMPLPQAVGLRLAVPVYVHQVLNDRGTGGTSPDPGGVLAGSAESVSGQPWGHL